MKKKLELHKKISICLGRKHVEGPIVFFSLILNHIGCIMVNMLPKSAVDRGFEPRSGQTKDYRIGICCFSAKHAALRRKSKDLLARNQDKVSGWSDMSIHGMLLQ